MGCANASQVAGGAYDFSVVDASSDVLAQRRALSDKRGQTPGLQPETSQPRVPFHRQQLLLARLGQGAFSCVYSARRLTQEGDQDLGEEVAAKVTDLRKGKGANKTELVDPRMKRLVDKEAEILFRVRSHKFVVTCIDHYVEGHLAYLVMEKCDMTLLQLLERRPVVTEQYLGHLFSDMLHALEGIHRMGIVHRDVKPDNFLYSYSGPGSSGVVKLCDFGLADAVGPKRPELNETYGTAPFMSPEMLETKGYDVKTDMWSFAVISYVLLLGHFPYTPTEKNSKAMKQAILLGTPAPSFRPKAGVLKCPNSNISEGALAFVRRGLERSPERRPSAGEALRHSWVKECTGPCDRECDSQALLVDIKPMIHAAKRVGAFTPPQPKLKAADSEIEEELITLQAKYHGEATRVNYGSSEPSSRKSSKKSPGSNKSVGGDKLYEGCPSSRPHSLSSLSTNAPSSDLVVSPSPSRQEAKFNVEVQANNMTAICL